MQIRPFVLPHHILLNDESLGLRFIGDIVTRKPKYEGEYLDALIQPSILGRQVFHAIGCGKIYRAGIGGIARIFITSQTNGPSTVSASAGIEALMPNRQLKIPILSLMDEFNEKDTLPLGLGFHLFCIQVGFCGRGVAGFLAL